MTAERTPVVFIHGLWLHASSWDPWVQLFREAGYEPVAPGWPGEPATVQEAREQPGLAANISIDDATAHFAEIIGSLQAQPVIIGHSFGGLFTEKLLGEDLGIAAVAIDPAQIKGVLPLPLAQLRAALPALGNPANLHKAVSLTAKEFRFGFGNELSEEESDTLFDQWAIPGPARVLFQAAAANFVLHSQAKVNTGNEKRGPLLLISGKEDHTVPDVTTRSTLKRYRDSTAVTELKQFEGRGHSLTIDSGWRDVADATLQWLAPITGHEAPLGPASAEARSARLPSTSDSPSFADGCDGDQGPDPLKGSLVPGGRVNRAVIDDLASSPTCLKPRSSHRLVGFVGCRLGPRRGRRVGRGLGCRRLRR